MTSETGAPDTDTDTECADNTESTDTTDTG